MCNISHIHVNKHVRTAEVSVNVYVRRCGCLDWMQASRGGGSCVFMICFHHCCSVTGGEVKSDYRFVFSFLLRSSLSREKKRRRGGGSQFVLSVCVGAGQREEQLD